MITTMMDTTIGASIFIFVPGCSRAVRKKTPGSDQPISQDILNRVRLQPSRAAGIEITTPSGISCTVASDWGTESISMSVLDGGEREELDLMEIILLLLAWQRQRTSSR